MTLSTPITTGNRMRLPSLSRSPPRKRSAAFNRVFLITSACSTLDGDDIVKVPIVDPHPTVGKPAKDIDKAGIPDDLVSGVRLTGMDGLGIGFIQAGQGYDDLGLRSGE